MLTSFDDQLPLLQAHTFSPEWFLNAELYQLEQQSLLHQTWQPLGRLDALQKPNAFQKATIAGESVLIVRGEDGILRAMSNICRHNANEIVKQEEGILSHFRCRYHGWTYANNGKLKGVPEGKGMENFPKEKNGLPPFRLEEWGPYAWVNFDQKASPLQGSMGPLMEQEGASFDQLEYYRSIDSLVEADWKLFVINFQDGGYHVNTTHPGLARAIDYKHYKTQLFDRCSVQRTPLSSDDPNLAAVRSGEARYWWMHPNIMMNFSGGVLDMNHVFPLGPGRCNVRFDFFFPKEWNGSAFTERKEESIRVAMKVQEEDKEVCESVQRGLHSSFFPGGRFTHREEGAHHFHGLLARDLREAAEHRKTSIRKGIDRLVRTFRPLLDAVLGKRAA